VDLGLIIREVPDLVVLNDEAHHIHDRELAWFRNIQDIANQLRRKNSKLSVQFDLTATPRHNNGGIFVQTISDYPLVEAIRQQVVKTPVLPDEASRTKLQERQSDRFTERFEDYLHLGYPEWKKAYEELLPTGKKAVLFVMTDDTNNCDEVRDYLEARYGDLKDAVLVIHTKGQRRNLRGIFGAEPGGAEEAARTEPRDRWLGQPVQGGRLGDDAARGVGRAERGDDRR
jgi:type III restriction enzyme